MMTSAHAKTFVACFLAGAMTACASQANGSLPSTSAATSFVQTATAPQAARFGASVASSPSTTGPARFAVSLPLRNVGELNKVLAALQNPASSQYHKWLTHEQFASRFGPPMAAKTAIARELQAAGFNVRIESQAVFANGTQAAAERYFGTHFALRTPSGSKTTVFTPQSPLRLSSLLVAQHAHVIGLDGLPPFHSNAVIRKPDGRTPKNYFGTDGPYFSSDLREAYEYPSYLDATGAGINVAIISSSPVVASDITEYFSEQGMSSPNVPTLVQFPIDGGGPLSGDGQGEATLDVEQVSGSAPRVTIGLFNVPALTDSYLLEGYSIEVQSDPEVMSSSIGGCEKQYDSAGVGIWTLDAFHNVFAEAATLGITNIAASGDNAAFQCGPNNTSSSLGVQAPTDDPLVVGVGGTNLYTNRVAGSKVSTYNHETAYAEAFGGHGDGDMWGSGGGYSVLYARPSYQNGFNTSAHRGVPDLGMHMGGPSADGNTDSTDWMRENGEWLQVEGTSAAAPEFAGLIALRVALKKERQGDIHALLYSYAKDSGVFRTGIPGNNGYATNTSKWDPVLGLGTPFGRFITGTPSDPVAGTPGSASNP